MLPQTIQKLLKDERGEFQYLGIGVVGLIFIAILGIIFLKVLLAKLAGGKVLKMSQNKMDRGISNVRKSIYR